MRIRKRLLSLLLCGVLLISLCSPSEFAQAQTTQDSGQITVNEGGLCEHHTEHTPDCGYTEVEPGTPCGFICGICGAEDTSLSNTAAITADQIPGNALEDKTSDPDKASDPERPEELVWVWSDEAPFLMEAEEEDDLSGQLFGITGASEICPTYEEAYNAMIAMEDEFYEGMPWTNFQPYGDRKSVV